MKIYFWRNMLTDLLCINGEDINCLALKIHSNLKNGIDNDLPSLTERKCLYGSN
jgi:hypothetical protein